MKRFCMRSIAMLLCLITIFTMAATGISPVTTVEAASKASNKNLLENANGSFEDAELDGWAAWNNKKEMTLSQERAKEGENSLKATKAGSAMASNKVSVVPGRKYIATVYVYGTAGGYLSVKFYDSIGRTVAAANDQVSVSKPANKWQKLTLTVTVPTGAVSAIVVVGTSAAGTSYFDCMYLEAAAVNLSTQNTTIKNGTFEGGYDSATELPEGWSNYTIGGNKKRVVVTDKVFKGSKSLKLYDAFTCLGSSKIDVIPGETYVASVQTMKTDGATGKRLLYLNFYDAKGNLISTFANNTPQKELNKWEEISVTALAPANAVKAAVAIGLNESPCTIYFDNVAITRVVTPTKLTNGNFEGEYNASTYLPEGWFNYVGSSVHHTLSDKYKKTQGNVMRLAPDSMQNITGMFSPFVAVTPGATYEATAKALGSSGSRQLFIRFYNDSVAVPNTTNHLSGNGMNTPTPITEWETLKTSAVAPAGATKACVLIILSGANGEGYFDDITLKKTADPAKDFDANLLYNGSVEMPTIVQQWWSQSGGDTSWTRVDKHATKGEWSIMVNDNDRKANAVFRAPMVEIEPGNYYTVSADFFVESGANAYLYIQFFTEENYNNYSKPIEGYSGATPCDQMGVKKTVEARAMAPEGAKYVGVFMATNTNDLCVAYIDNVRIEKDTELYKEWEVKETGHPRVFFTQDEVDDIKAMAYDTTENAFGYSQAETFQELLAVADKALTEKEITLYYWHSWPATFPLPPEKHMPEQPADPPGWVGVPYPYMGNYYRQLQWRMQALSVAYVVTGEKKYFNKALEYATNISSWDMWTETVDGKQEGGLGIGYLLQGVCTVYDLLYNDMTAKQQKQLREAIITKGLKPQYLKSVNPYDNNIPLVCGATLGLGTTAVIGDDPKWDKQLNHYLSVTEDYCMWYLDSRYTYGTQEGYSYTDYALGNLMQAMDAMERVTTASGMLEHPYLREILPDWAVNFTAPGSGIAPGISDSDPGAYFFIPMSILNKRFGDEKAGLHLQLSKVNGSAFETFIYTSPNPVIGDKEEVLGLSYVSEYLGYGSMKTGWRVSDMMMVMVSNHSRMNHNHYDQNSFQLAWNGVWIATDPGYADLNPGTDANLHDVWRNHTTLFVDDEHQSVLGAGSLKEKLASNLYGYMVGSAPGAYGAGVLSQFDRHAIMVNHEKNPYYIVIDDLDSKTSHTYGWNLYTNQWSELYVDGQAVDLGKNKVGSSMALVKSGNALFVQFIGNEKLTVKTGTFRDLGEWTLTVDSEKAKDYQFMSIINAGSPAGAGAQLIQFPPILKRSSTEFTGNTPGEVNWSTSARSNEDMVKVVDGELIFFRGQEPGDWYSIPFSVDQEGDYDVTINMTELNGYGDYQMYIDGKPYGEVYCGYARQRGVRKHSLGTVHLTAEQHTLKLVLVSVCEKSNGQTAYIGANSMVLTPAGMESSAPSSAISVQESYDTSSVLGAKVGYAAGASDVILFNRGTSSISAGGVNTDAKQATVMGVIDNAITEGFAATGVTKLTFNGNTLIEARKPVDISMDYTRGAATVEVHSAVTQTIKVSLSGRKYNINEKNAYIEGDMLLLKVVAGKNTFALECKHNYNQEVVHIDYQKAEAGCVEAAVYFKSCICGKAGEETFHHGEPTGHDWRDAICYAPKTCFTCRATEGEALGHDWIPATCTTPQTCSRCPMVGELALGHELVEVQSGDTVYWECTRCGKFYSDSNGENEIPNPNGDESGNSGGNTLLFVIIGAAVLVLGGIILFFILWKKRKKDEDEETVAAEESVTTEETAAIEESATEEETQE